MQRDPIGYADSLDLYKYVGNQPVNFIDPLGLYTMSEFLRDATNFSAGFGDNITFGVTNYIRDLIGTNSFVNLCSGAYSVGTYAATAADLALGGAGVLKNLEKQGGKYLYKNVYKATFSSKASSLIYHLKQHGKGRASYQYVKDAQEFFAKNKQFGKGVILRDGSPGIKIKTKGGPGGYWTNDGRLVTFWD